MGGAADAQDAGLPAARRGQRCCPKLEPRTGGREREGGTPVRQSRSCVASRSSSRSPREPLPGGRRGASRCPARAWPFRAALPWGAGAGRPLRRRAEQRRSSGAEGLRSLARRFSFGGGAARPAWFSGASVCDGARQRAAQLWLRPRCNRQAPRRLGGRLSAASLPVSRETSASERGAYWEDREIALKLLPPPSGALWKAARSI